MSESQPLSGTTNELVKERTRAAAERSRGLSRNGTETHAKHF
jgi:hypothetical protein